MMVFFHEDGRRDVGFSRQNGEVLVKQLEETRHFYVGYLPKLGFAVVSGGPSEMTFHRDDGTIAVLTEANKWVPRFDPPLYGPP